VAVVDGRALRWAGHREQRRAEFVEAALAVIDRDGPGATVDAIAGERGVSRQALYRQFDDRADLDRAIAQRAADDLVLALLPALALQGDVATSVRSALEAYLDHVQAHLPLYRFVRSHEAGSLGGVVENVKDSIAVRVATVAHEYVVNAGLVPEDFEKTFAIGVVGLADAVVQHWLDEPGGVTRAELVERLVLMVGGLVDAVLPTLRES
jgi:AcrR family transcriptional regulator